MVNNTLKYTLLFFAVLQVGLLLGQNKGATTSAKKMNPDYTGLRAIGSPANPKVPMSWNRYHDYQQITDFCKNLERAFPNLVKVVSIGKSHEGRDLWLLKVTDYTQGADTDKPAMYIDGNIHSNELQGSEISMYTAWYMVENFAHVPYFQALLRDKAFYILPTAAPDARENFIYQPNNPNSPRSGMLALDDDGDGYVNEDGFDDLDGDGNIVMMRRPNPYGRWKVDPENPLRMVRAKQDEHGTHDMLGYEGIDNDGDGRINEDGTGSYDPNRDWGWNWQPDYVQRGALYYPGSLPETKAVKDFVYAHPNIAGAQMYHNYGGMFLRGPGAEEDKKYYTQDDIAVYDFIGKIGEKMIPGYNYYTLYKDLYTVYGGAIDWISLGRGIFTFSNELMTSYLLFNKDSKEGRWQNNEFYEFDKYLLFHDAYVPWTSVDHPQYGKIEVGGPKKNYIRNHPGFMLEEDAHRNMAFTILHAEQMPQLEIMDIRTKNLGGGLTEVTASVVNHRVIPTRSAHDVKHGISQPDLINIQGVKVISGMVVEDEYLNKTNEQKYKPESIQVATIPGMEEVKVRWIVSGKLGKEAAIEVMSQKGGKVKKLIAP